MKNGLEGVRLEAGIPSDFLSNWLRNVGGINCRDRENLMRIG
jgi:hypothetical protein